MKRSNLSCLQIEKKLCFYYIVTADNKIEDIDPRKKQTLKSEKLKKISQSISLTLTYHGIV